MTHLAVRRLGKWQGVAGGAASLQRHLSRCDSDTKLGPRLAAAAADRCRGRGPRGRREFEEIAGQKEP